VVEYHKIFWNRIHTRTSIYIYIYIYTHPFDSKLVKNVNKLQLQAFNPKCMCAVYSMCFYAYYRSSL